MRNIAILIFAVCITSLFTYFLVHTGDEPSRSSADSQTSSQRLENQIKEMADSLHEYYQSHQRELQQAQQERTRLNYIFTDLNARLQDLETLFSESIDNEYFENEDTEENDDVSKRKLHRISEIDLAHWINETLHENIVDNESTHILTEQAITTLTELPDVNLDEMRCTGDFCRATLAGLDGRPEETGSLFGKPPFINDGFILNKPDGSILLYFTRPGISLDELRSKALAQLGSP
jgi:hypothetical protein